MSASATVPEGYKQTEIGVFPKDWEIKKFGDIFDFKSTASNSRSDLTETDEAHYIHYGDIHTIFHRHLDISKQSTPRIDLSLCKNATRIRNGDWVMADASEDFSGICKAIEISGIDEDKSVVAGLHTFLLRDRKEEYSPGFKGHLGEAKFLHDQYVRVSVGLKVFGVTKTSLRDLLIPVPPKTQQTRIEEILTQADAQIQSFEHLIAKKRDIKQGAMQELLTGKTRLPGFSNEWNLILMPEICWFQEGPGVRNTQFVSSGVKLLNGTNILEGQLYLERTDKYISKAEAYGGYSHFLASSGDIVIACSGVTIKNFHKKVAFVKEWHLPLCMNTSTMRFQPKKDKLSKEYLYQYLTSKNFKEQISGKATGSAQLNFGPSHVAKVRIKLPSLREQKVIAEILSDMDAEIAALEERLEKAKAIKQGMMQQLLTGKIRLVD